MTVQELKSRIYDLMMEKDYIINHTNEIISQINNEIRSVQQQLEEISTQEEKVEE